MMSASKRPAIKLGSDLIDAHLECILTAANEDEVKLCMELADAAMDKFDENGLDEDEVSSWANLGACVSAANSGEDLDECVVISDLHDEHCYG